MEQRRNGFSARETRAFVWLLPVLVVAGWLVWEIVRQEGVGGSRNDAEEVLSRDVSLSRIEVDGERYVMDGADDAGGLDSAAEKQITPALFVFDPNTVDYHDLVRLGFTRGEALGIVKYRERGKVFEIPEDFAACYQVTEAMYLRLEPYIRIGERYRLKPFARSDGRVGGTAQGASSERTRVPVSTGGNREYNGGDTAASTEAGESQYTRGTSYGDGTLRDAGTEMRWQVVNERPLVELNSADSAALVSVSGIGVVTMIRIMEYRARLGGFASVEQLAEVRGMTEQNYERILGQIYVDDSVIKKIDVNFAPAKELASHPYIRAEALRKLLKQRQLKGGWRTTGELEEDDIFTPEELAKLGPYLLFNQ